MRNRTANCDVGGDSDMTIENLRNRIRGAVITAFEPRLGAEADDMIWNGRKPCWMAYTG